MRDSCYDSDRFIVFKTLSEASVYFLSPRRGLNASVPEGPQIVARSHAERGIAENRGASCYEFRSWFDFETVSKTSIAVARIASTRVPVRMN